MQAGERFLRAFGSGDREPLEELYAEDAVFWAPLTGPLKGREAIGSYFGELHGAFPGMRVTLHFVGDNAFHMPHQELVAWRMPFPEDTPDPAPPIASSTVPVPAERQ